MRLLVDTQLLIWVGEAPERLSRKATAYLADPAHQPLISPLSVTEVAIKFALGRPGFTIDPRRFRELLIGAGFAELPLTGAHAERLADLPAFHKDPFDRLLVAQALAEGVPLITADAMLANYPGQVIVV